MGLYATKRHVCVHSDIISLLLTSCLWLFYVKAILLMVVLPHRALKVLQMALYLIDHCVLNLSFTE